MDRPDPGDREQFGRAAEQCRQQLRGDWRFRGYPREKFEDAFQDALVITLSGASDVPGVLSLLRYGTEAAVASAIGEYRQAALAQSVEAGSADTTHWIVFVELALVQPDNEKRRWARAAAKDLNVQIRRMRAPYDGEKRALRWHLHLLMRDILRPRCLPRPFAPGEEVVDEHSSVEELLIVAFEKQVLYAELALLSARQRWVFLARHSEVLDDFVLANPNELDRTLEDAARKLLSANDEVNLKDIEAAFAPYLGWQVNVANPHNNAAHHYHAALRRLRAAAAKEDEPMAPAKTKAPSPAVPPVILHAAHPGALATPGVVEAVYRRATKLVEPSLRAEHAPLVAEAERRADAATGGRYSEWKQRVDDGTLPREPAANPGERPFGFAFAGELDLSVKPTHGADRDRRYELVIRSRPGGTRVDCARGDRAPAVRFGFRIVWFPEEEAAALAALGLERSHLGALRILVGEERWPSLLDVLLPLRFGLSGDAVFGRAIGASVAAGSLRIPRFVRFWLVEPSRT